MDMVYVMSHEDEHSDVCVFPSNLLVHQ